ncbi:MAG: alpha/beta fold hydrolase [Chloroflexi bacterium]|nr:alpha/beta fold hydrolase [Chloroflexota bacterium]
MRAIHLSKAARRQHGLDPAADPRCALSVADVAAARLAAHGINADRIAGRAPGPATVTAGELIAAGVLHEVFHRLVDVYDSDIEPGAVSAAVAALEADGEPAVERFVEALADAFGRESLPPGHAATLPDEPAALRSEALVEGLLLAVLNDDPAAAAVRDLVDDRALRRQRGYASVLDALEANLEAAAGTTPAARRAALAARVARERRRRAIPPGEPARRRRGRSPLAGRSLPELLRAPSAASPHSLAGQLRWIRDHWGELIAGVEGLEDRILLASDLVIEEQRALPRHFGGAAGPTERPDLGGLDAEPERFSADTDWMPNVVLQAKSTYVWLDQLSRRFGRDVRTLDTIPDEALDELAGWGVTGLWLIGLWQRSRASEQIKRLRGNPDAAASAYSLDDYRIADDLGGEAAYATLRDRAAARGIRLASDMVPNHMGIDSSWVVEHPDRFLSVPQPPFPAYTFTGPNLSADGRVELRLEDHYWDSSDAAVVFERRDSASGERRYIYHGNDGTSFPWNDTAQLDYLRAEVREAVIQTILAVARRFPIIRFDAAMVLARRHVRRLWWPEPGTGGGIPSRAEHAMSNAAFNRLMPVEFWRDVVDRVAAEVPGTLLLAEAFWLMEGYFVRTLGMHRVYNSAFMHMLRDENGAGYRKVISDTLEFDPAILERYVNFLSNPDEESAREQFGTGDKYIGAATVLATLPGLPMLAHGQLEGLRERYGMEFRRATFDEGRDEGLLARHEQAIVPLLRARRRFAGSRDFRLYDLVTDAGVDEHVYAYTNGSGIDRSLVVHHDRFAATRGRIRLSGPFAVRDALGGRRLDRTPIADALGLSGDAEALVSFLDPRTGFGLVTGVGEIREQGLALELGAYESRAFTVIEEHPSHDRAWRELAAELGGRGSPALLEAHAERVRVLEAEGAAAARAEAAAAALADPAARRAALEARAADPERPRASHEPGADRRIELPDGRHLAVAEWGDPDGTPVLLLHGRPGSRLLAPDPAVTEARGIRLLTMDRPGYGESTPHPGRSLEDDAGDVAAVARSLGIDALSIVGWSSGGAFALTAAAHLPNLVRAVAVVAGDAPIDATPDVLAAFSDPARDLLREVRAGDGTARDRVAARFAWYAHDPTGFLEAAQATAAEDDPDAILRRRPEVRDALQAMFMEGARQGTAGVADDWVAEMRPWDVDLAAIRARVDLWWGERDGLTPRAQVEALARLMPRATVHVIPDAGHSLPMARWGEILDPLLARAQVRPRGRSGAAAGAAAPRGRSRPRGAGGR